MEIELEQKYINGNVKILTKQELPSAQGIEYGNLYYLNYCNFVNSLFTKYDNRLVKKYWNGKICFAIYKGRN